MRIAHITDTHFDWLEDEETVRWTAASICAGLDAEVPLVLTGDIALGDTFCAALLAFAEGCGDRAVYFVLGNHDAWRTGIARSRQAAAILSRKHPQLVYLPAAGVVELTPTTCLVGLDGWYDMRAGDVYGSSVRLVDFSAVEELRGLHPDRRREELQARGQRDALRARALLTDALDHYEHVVFATHVPPFTASAVYADGPSDAAHQPFYVNYSLGLALDVVASTYPAKRITVFCGHSHGAADVQVRANLRVLTGAAEYGKPALAGVWEV